MAARVLLDHYAGGRIDVRSAGSEPAHEINPSVVAVLRERGLDPSQEFPKPLVGESALEADVIVTMGCGESCPVYPGKHYVDWNLQDPAGLPVERSGQSLRRLTVEYKRSKKRCCRTSPSDRRGPSSG